MIIAKLKDIFVNIYEVHFVLNLYVSIIFFYLL